LDTLNEETPSEESSNHVDIRVSSPKLSHLDKLYVRAFLSSLDHVKAHRAVAPTLKSHHSDNIYSRKDAVQFHINLSLQERLEAFELTPELIIAKLYKEATREGAGSNHAARVTALTTIGKQLGMFQDKKESLVPTINIISYAVETNSLQAIPEEVKGLEVIEEDTYEEKTNSGYEINYI
jgi:hypothetical protein